MALIGYGYFEAQRTLVTDPACCQSNKIGHWHAKCHDDEGEVEDDGSGAERLSDHYCVFSTSRDAPFQPALSRNAGNIWRVGQRANGDPASHRCSGCAVWL